MTASPNGSPTIRSSEFSLRYGPWAVVTGASDGIGRSFATALAARGLNLLLVARREAVLQALADDLQAAHGVQCRVLAADLSSAEGQAAVREASDGLDVGLAVCAAGFGSSGDFLDSDLDNELNMLRLNCEATTTLAWHLGQRLVQRGRGGLILLSSIVAFQGVPRSAHYAATKAYVQTLAEGLRQEWRGRGVEVLAVAPGPVNTGFAARSKMAITRADTPDEVARYSLMALGLLGTVRPGRLASLMGYALALLPRAVRVRIMAQAMKGMT
ncbi:SDR family NAD(P)-dependent oxidoreductase [Amphibiibacter pelophylacis]|uniref:SDR family NAD(P)-dependent oxidoreductase n=1 Tax=Amphibiibacter pelophylacis TaxID=1799477 RepID=A0ACC6P3W6_9BURK